MRRLVMYRGYNKYNNTPLSKTENLCCKMGNPKRKECQHVPDDVQ